MQDLDEFKVVTDRHPEDRRRLQELAEQIPAGYGAGDTYDRAHLEVKRLESALALAKAAADSLFTAYTVCLNLMHEERRILEGLGLTANLFRKDAQ